MCIEAAASYYCSVEKLVEEAKDDGFRKGLLACHTTILTKMKAWKPAYVEKKKGTFEWELSKKRQYDEAQLKKRCAVDKLPPVVMQAFKMKQDGSKKVFTMDPPEQEYSEVWVIRTSGVEHSEQTLTPDEVLRDAQSEEVSRLEFTVSACASDRQADLGGHYERTTAPLA